MKTINTKNVKKMVCLGSLKLREEFMVEGSDAHYQFMGAMQNAGEYAVENVMTGRRDVWLGRVMVVVDRKAPKTHKGITQIGTSCVFVRDGNAWSGCEVSILAKTGNGFEVARCCWVADYFLAVQNGVKPSRIKSWIAHEDELC